MSLLNTTLRHKRSHGEKHYHRPNVEKSFESRSHSKIFNDLLSDLHHPLGSHFIRTKNFALPVYFQKKCLRDYPLDKGCTNAFSPIYRMVSMLWDVALFKNVRSEPLYKGERQCLPVQFTNRWIDATVLYHKEVTYKNPHYFPNQFVLIVSHSFTKTMHLKYLIISKLDLEQYNNDFSLTWF